VTTGSRNGRTLKKQVVAVLEDDDFEAKMSELFRFPAIKVVNVLFSLLLNPDETIRWRAVSAMGAAMDALARTDMEAARVVMRRLMWSLNDESGGIGWGAPEVMGEVMTRNEALADEYATIFISYLDERGNFLEYEPLQRGLLWGLVRLARLRPELLESAGPLLRRFLDSTDPTVRGLAAMAAGLLKIRGCRSVLRALTDDDSGLRIYVEPGFLHRRIGDLAEEALGLLDNGEASLAG